MDAPNFDRFFRETTLRISSSLDVSQALESLCLYLQDFIPFDFSGIYYDDKSIHNDIYNIAEYNLSKGQIRKRPVARISWDVIKRLEKIYKPTKGAKSIIRNNPDETSEELLAHFDHLRGCSNLIMSLIIEDNNVGTIVFSKKGWNVFSPKHSHLLNLIHDPIAIAVSNARRYEEMKRLKDQLAEENKTMQREIENLSGNRVIGADFGLSHVMDLVRQVAPMSSPVLLTGETGTGKEVIAKAIHLESNRRNRPFIRVQCGAVPDTLLSSELFGHEKGAFTGALQNKRGRFERAHTGTLFLDEIGELTPDAQVKLLRVLQEKEFERLGGTKTIRVDVRVIVATHRNLKQMVENGSFREDLWFRLNVFPIHIPPLRERKEDIINLCKYFIDRKCREMNLLNRPQISIKDLKTLSKYNWPGNVRELQNVIERALILSKGQTLQLPSMNNEEKPWNHSSAAQEEPPYTRTIKSLDEHTRDYIETTLAQTHGKIEGPDGAATILKLHPSTLRGKMRKLGIPFGRR